MKSSVLRTPRIPRRYSVSLSNVMSRLWWYTNSGQLRTKYRVCTLRCVILIASEPSGIYFIFVFIFLRKALDIFDKSGLKGLEAEKASAALLFTDYKKGTTPRGSIKHLWVLNPFNLYFHSVSLAKEPREVFQAIVKCIEDSYEMGNLLIVVLFSFKCIWKYPWIFLHPCVYKKSIHGYFHMTASMFVVRAAQENRLKTGTRVRHSTRHLKYLINS